MIERPAEAEIDLLATAGINEFKSRVAIAANAVLTQSENFTNTLEFSADNVAFSVEEFIKRLEPDTNVVAYTCNFAKKYYHGYEAPPAKKGKAKRKNSRKQQGTGDEFNSQITFVVRSRGVAVDVDGNLPADAKTYKFKVFQNGKIQLPGAKDSTIEDALACAHAVLGVLNGALHPDGTIVSRFTHARAVMRNYKFQIKFANERQIIDFAELHRALLADRAEQTTLPGTNQIMEVKKTGSLSVSMLFASQSPANNHGGRVVIYLRGKVNILGGKLYCDAENIGAYMTKLFTDKREQLIVTADDL